MTKRYFYSSHELPASEKYAAISFGASLATQGKVHVLLKVKKDAGNHLHDVFSTSDVNRLKQGLSVEFNDVTLFLESEATMKDYLDYEVVVGIHVSDSLLHKLEKSQNVGHLIVANWDMDTPQEWMKHEPARLKIE